MTDINYSSPDYKRSRAAYMAQCTFEYFVTLLVTDAFLAKLLGHIGLSDSAIGIVSSFVSLAFIIQLASIPLVRTKISTKTLVITFDTLSLFFFMSMFLVPFLPFGQDIKKFLIIAAILLAYIFKYLIYSICFKWANSYVDPCKRATYSATKEMLSLITGILFTMIIGYIIDRYESIGNLTGGFMFIAISIFILNVCNFTCLLMIKKENKAEFAAGNAPFNEVVKNTFGNRSFIKILLFMALFKFSTYLTTGFLGIFKTKDLALSLFAVQTINMVANGFRLLVSVPFGKFSDRYSFARGFELALLIVLASYLFLTFTTPGTWFFIVIYSVLYNISIAGTNQNSFNIMYSYVDSKYITQAMSISNCVGGGVGFIGSLIGGKILDAIQANGNSIFGINVYGQQVLALLSAAITIVSILFLHFSIGKEKIKVQ